MKPAPAKNASGGGGGGGGHGELVGVGGEVEGWTR